MPEVFIPLGQGTGKNPKSGDFCDQLAINMLTVPKPVLESEGYIKSFPGIQVHMSSVAGSSRGADYNTKENITYRVCGEYLYRGIEKIARVPGAPNRVSMAHSVHSQATISRGKLLMYKYGGKELTELVNWPLSTKNPQYDIGKVLDICHNRGRYIWVKAGSDTFGVTDLADETHPDRFRPFYRTEMSSDPLLGVAAWRGMIVCFGSSTVEYFTLTGAVETSEPIYVAQPALMVPVGIAGTYCKCHFGDSFAVLSNPASGAPTVYLIDNGGKTNIATDQIEKILQRYSADELSTAVMESLRFEGHELLLVHLPSHTLCFDARGAEGGQWCLLQSGVRGMHHGGIDYMSDATGITLGDKKVGRLGKLDPCTSAQYGEHTEHLLFTALVTAKDALLFDFKIDCVLATQYPKAERLLMSCTTDGVTYGREQLIVGSDRYAYTGRVIWARVGRCRDKIGFRIRIVTITPASLTNCRIRVENS